MHCARSIEGWDGMIDRRLRAKQKVSRDSGNSHTVVYTGNLDVKEIVGQAYEWDSKSADQYMILAEHASNFINRILDNCTISLR